MKVLLGNVLVDMVLSPNAYDALMGVIDGPDRHYGQECRVLRVEYEGDGVNLIGSTGDGAYVLVLGRN